MVAAPPSRAGTPRRTNPTYHPQRIFLRCAIYAGNNNGEWGFLLGTFYLQNANHLRVRRSRCASLSPTPRDATQRNDGTTSDDSHHRNHDCRLRRRFNRIQWHLCSLTEDPRTAPKTYKEHGAGLVMGGLKPMREYGYGAIGPSSGAVICERVGAFIYLDS